MITKGFKPDFENAEEGKFSQVPGRTMRSRRINKEKKNGKRIMKRFKYDATSQQSSYSELVSAYVQESIQDLEPDSNFVEEYSHPSPISENVANSQPERKEGIGYSPQMNQGNPESHSPPGSKQNGSPMGSNGSSGRNGSGSNSIPSEEIDDHDHFRNISSIIPTKSSNLFRQ
uniref:Uncharacterized protein n=1 Tax=Euplotes crassus TaxID=5936 RepID=A0A7S3NUH9_EUPCR|mmetsp:Transcript_22006/g.21732  ORF Transcript_22006/g.21732 Transcript_22006/m.21732 type:complete len:173 (+) Transcript_22006:143-661(+)